VVRDRDGRRFLDEVDARGELAPRDVVARAVWRRTVEQGGEPVYLDATALGAAFLASRFPGLDTACRATGFDWSREPVPITPAAHYAMGGVVTDLDGRSSLPGLFAVGETARTGVHGANRLASNSLLEAAVFADRAVRAFAAPPPQVRNSGADTWRARPTEAAHGASTDASGVAHDAGSASTFRRDDLQAVMWEHVGLERDADGLAAASARLASWRAPVVRDRHSAEDRNLLDLARLTVAAAIARHESVGAHFRSDAPGSAYRSIPEQEAA
ncbi:FAD-binding protein, partial [Agromyces albus]